jgi:hypothetical protein
MDAIKKILDVCSVILGFFLICYIGGLVLEIYERIRNKTKEKLHINPFGVIRYITGSNDAVFALAVAVLIAGAANEIARPVLKKNEIGAFYEPGNYSQSYEAYIYPYDGSYDATFCIVDFYRYTGEGLSDYHISAVNFPYGRTVYTDKIYNPKSSKNEIDLNMDCYRIQLTGPATAESYVKLSEAVVSSSGGFCASRNSDLVHRVDCRHVRRISEDSKIFFGSAREAQMFCFEPCDTCEPFS